MQVIWTSRWRPFQLSFNCYLRDKYLAGNDRETLYPFDALYKIYFGSGLILVSAIPTRFYLRWVRFYQTNTGKGVSTLSSWRCFRVHWLCTRWICSISCVMTHLLNPFYCTCFQHWLHLHVWLNIDVFQVIESKSMRKYSCYCWTWISGNPWAGTEQQRTSQWVERSVHYPLIIRGYHVLCVTLQHWPYISLPDVDVHTRFTWICSGNLQCESLRLD